MFFPVFFLFPDFAAAQNEAQPGRVLDVRRHRRAQGAQSAAVKRLQPLAIDRGVRPSRLRVIHAVQKQQFLRAARGGKHGAAFFRRREAIRAAADDQRRRRQLSQAFDRAQFFRRNAEPLIGLVFQQGRQQGRKGLQCATAATRLRMALSMSE